MRHSGEEMMTTHALRFSLVALLAATALPPVVRAQAPAPGQPAPKSAAPAPKPDLPAPPANYEYSFAGRRDPFINLVNRGLDQATSNQPVKRAEGLPGMMTSELTVRGIVQTRGAWVAMVSGVDGKVYSVRAGQKLADGVVREVTAQAVVILQEVNDPLSLAKQREVRKLLRGGEEVK
jgi:Tfp pilus assembly protein PilP